MDMPKNQFKANLAKPDVQYGMWVSLADPVAAEISAGAGFDWLLIDGEHSPNDLRTVLAQLQAVQAYPTSAIVRPVVGERHLIKQYLDLGVQTILVPMVSSARQAEEMVAAVRYPPEGVRGVATARGSRWGRVENYWAQANNEMCVIVQIETIEGLEALDEIAAVEGVDAVFIGPSDLGAALGHLGDVSNSEVRSAVCQAISTLASRGVPVGVLAISPELVEEYVAAGARFVGVGVDTALLARTTSDLAAHYRDRT